MHHLDTTFQELKTSADAANIRVDFRLSYPAEKVYTPMQEPETQQLQ